MTNRPEGEKDALIWDERFVAPDVEDREQSLFQRGEFGDENGDGDVAEGEK